MQLAAEHNDALETVLKGYWPLWFSSFTFFFLSQFSCIYSDRFI